jgi:hypothetical protein
MTKTSRKSVSQAEPKKPVITPKRTPVKKTTAVAKKRPATPKKKSITAKKPVADKKNSSTRTKTPVKVKTAKAVTANKKAKKSPTKSTTKNTTDPKEATAKRTPKSQPVVVLPTRMSIRAREKALVLADTFEKDFYSAGVTIAKVSGFCFLLIGTLVTYTQLTHTPALDAVCSGGACTVAQVSGALNDTLSSETNQNNYVELLADIPDVIESPLGLPIEFSSVQTVTAYVRHLTDGGSTRTELPLKSIGNNKYEIYIDPAELPPNHYELKILVLHQDMTQKTNYALGNFAIIDTTDQHVVTAPESELDKTQTVTTSTDSSATKEEETKETTITTKQSLDLEADTNDTSLSDTALVTKKEPDPVAEVELEKATVVEKNATTSEESTTLDPVVKSDTLRITTSNILSDITTITVENAIKQGVVSFYIRPLQTLNTQFIGQLIPGTRTFKFDTKQFPNGQYQLYAQEQQKDVLNKSNATQFTIQNETLRTNIEPVSNTQERELLDIAKALPDPDITEPITERLTADATNQQATTTTPTTDTLDRARAVLRADANMLDELFQRYAVAVQSGDPALQAEANKAIQTYREDLISTALNSDRDRSIASELDMILEDELIKLAEKVRTFEAIRRERTENESAIDTDGDGISDFDEITLYKTDPTRADTDNDGFTDGAEIIRGYNPTNAAAEAAITYQSPREAAGVVKTDTLQVTAVIPEIQLPANDNPGSVRTVVKGRGLPNSFVTVYIFSTPTVVTVRTEADGTFEYTFNQELEDGRHQVYVALTDNAGSIVAQSEPFTFVKQAQAFTAIEEDETVTVLTATNISDQLASYRVVLGMSVFALGMLLILLGIGLRSSKPEGLVLEDNPV